MNAPTLRPYQSDLVTDIRKAFRDGFKCPLLVASTGMGKTLMFSYITHSASQKGNPVVITAHRKEIIQQISLSLAKFGVEHQIIAPDVKVRAIKIAHFKSFGRSYVNNLSDVMVGSVQTIVGRLATVDATVKRSGGKLLVVVDEGHHCVEDTQWGRLMSHCRDMHDSLGLIVTASPERLDGRGLGAGHGGYADTMVEAPPMSWAIENGFLSPYRAFVAQNPIDMTGVKIKMGEYSTAETEERVDKPSITGDAIAHYRQHASGLRAVAFCVSIKHSQHVAAEFNAAGIPAAHIDGGTDDLAREKAIIDFADGNIMVLTQVNLISEGFDLSAIAQKDVTIDCLIDLAPTASLVNAMQRWGRALRPRLGKPYAIFLDHAGNISRHGLPDAEREWSLEGRKKKKGKAAKDDQPDVLVKTCPECFAIFAPAPVCPNCGHQLEVKERKIEHKDGELQELTQEQKELLRAQAKRRQSQAQTVDDLVSVMGYSRARAQHIINAREEKAEIHDRLKVALIEWNRRTGGSINARFGVFMSDLRSMSANQMRKILSQVQEELQNTLSIS